MLDPLAALTLTTVSVFGVIGAIDEDSTALVILFLLMGLVGGGDLGPHVGIDAGIAQLVTVIGLISAGALSFSK